MPLMSPSEPDSDIVRDTVRISTEFLERRFSIYVGLPREDTIGTLFW
jgi:hypothetical protein